MGWLLWVGRLVGWVVVVVGAAWGGCEVSAKHAPLVFGIILYHVLADPGAGVRGGRGPWRAVRVRAGRNLDARVK